MKDNARVEGGRRRYTDEEREAILSDAEALGVSTTGAVLAYVARAEPGSEWAQLVAIPGIADADGGAFDHAWVPRTAVSFEVHGMELRSNTPHGAPRHRARPSVRETAPVAGSSTPSEQGLATDGPFDHRELAFELSAFDEAPPALRYTLLDARGRVLWRCGPEPAGKVGIVVLDARCASTRTWYRGPGSYFLRVRYRPGDGRRMRTQTSRFDLDGRESRVLVRLRFLERTTEDYRWLRQVVVIGIEPTPRGLTLHRDSVSSAAGFLRYHVDARTRAGLFGLANSLERWQQGHWRAIWSEDFTSTTPWLASTGVLTLAGAARRRTRLPLEPGRYRYRATIFALHVRGTIVSYANAMREDPVAYVFGAHELVDVFEIAEPTSTEEEHASRSGR
jgi:hypothetical protein